jgi:drug/metabolite transporter (DMT)-like permease
MNEQIQAYLAFGLITICWGITFPLIRMSVQVLTPPQFVMLRFGCALLLLSPLLLYRLNKKGWTVLRDVFPKSFLLGVVSWVSYQTQTLGLQSVEAGRAAFITGTSVVMIPLMSPLFGHGKPDKIDLLAAAVALFGLYLLTDPSGQGVVIGDLWIILCAIFYAVFVHLFQIWIKKNSDAILVTFSQLLGVFTCSSLLHLTDHSSLPRMSHQVLLALGICALFATVLATILQTRYQPFLTPEKAALIFSLESVFASIFGYLILGEALNPTGIVGCLLIFGSITGSELYRWRMARLKSQDPTERLYQLEKSRSDRPIIN